MSSDEVLEERGDRAIGLETFRCVPLSCKQTRRACAERYSKRGGRKGWAGSSQPARPPAGPCAGCEVGAAHARGERVERWPDGAPIEVHAPLVVHLEPPLELEGEPVLVDVQITAVDEAAEQPPTGGEEQSMQPGSQSLTGGGAPPAEPPAEPPRIDFNREQEPGEVHLGPPLELEVQGIRLTVTGWTRHPDCAASDSLIRGRLKGGWYARDAVLVPPGGEAVFGRAPADDEELDHEDLEGELESWERWARDLVQAPIEDELEHEAVEQLEGLALRRRLEELLVEEAGDVDAIKTWALAFLEELGEEDPALDNVPDLAAHLGKVLEERAAELGLELSAWVEWADAQVGESYSAAEARTFLEAKIGDEGEERMHLAEWRGWAASKLGKRGEERGDRELRELLEAHVDELERQAAGPDPEIARRLGAGKRAADELIVAEARIRELEASLAYEREVATRMRRRICGLEESLGRPDLGALAAPTLEAVAARRVQRPPLGAPERTASPLGGIYLQTPIGDVTFQVRATSPRPAARQLKKLAELLELTASFEQSEGIHG